MSLPIVNTRSQKNISPSVSGINKGIKLASLDSTGEAARYLLSQVERRLNNAGALEKDSFSNVLETLKNFVKYVETAFSAGDPWSGKARLPWFQNFHELLASDSAKVIDLEKQIQFDFAVSKQSELVRGYTTNDGELDDPTMGAMDNLLNAWLVKNQMINTDGIVYKATTDGKALKNQDGGLERADPERLKSSMMDKENGFEAYVLKNNSAAQVTANLRSYGDEASAEQTSESSSTRRG